jgi:RNA polymerase sigma-70 factor, ECF subfamily
MRHPPNLTSADEAVVVTLAKSGDAAAFEELVKRRQSWLRNLLRRLSGDADLADDLAQQTLLKAWRSLAGLKTNLAFGAWLRQMAVNAWLDRARRNDPLELTVAADEAAIDSSDPVDPTPSAEGIDLHRALAELTLPVRTCVVLSYGEGMSHAEIAALTELPLGTVKSHINRGLRRLRCILDTEGS